MAKTPSPNDTVVVQHKSLKGAQPRSISRRAYERVWKKKGFQLVHDPAAKKAAKTSTTGEGGSGSGS